MKRTLILAGLLTLIACSPAYAWQDYQLKRIVRNLHQVNSFEGTIVEKGLLPEDEEVKTDVIYARPNRFAARIAEPLEWAGTTATYDGETLIYHYPQLRWAIRFRGLHLPEGDDADRLIEYQYRRDLAHFDYHISGSTKVAGLATLTLWHNAKARNGWNHRGFTKVYDKYSFAVAGESEFEGDVTYGYRYDRIAFNTDIDDSTFTIALPADTLISDWDLSGAAWEEERMRKEVKFPLILPDTNALGLVRRKIVRAAGPIPAYCARYERGVHFVLVTAFASNGMSVPEYGLPIKAGQEDGRLILGPLMSSYAFVHDGTYYSLLGNLPYEELIALGQKISGS